MAGAFISSHIRSPACLARLPFLLAGIIAALLIWSAFRGLDLLDAATHFLTYQFPADNPDTHTHYDLIARPVWLLCRSNIVIFRVVCFALITGAVFAFWCTCHSIITTAHEKYWAGLALWLSALGGFAWLPVVLGYNSLSAFFALLGLAALAPGLELTSASPIPPGRRFACAAFFAALVSATALVKPPAALALAGWGGFLTLSLFRAPTQLRLALIGLSTVTLIYGLWLAVQWISVPGSDPNQMIEVAGIHLSAAWIISTLARYQEELGRFLPALGTDVLFVSVPALGLAALIAARLWRRINTPRLMNLGLGAIAASWTIVLVYRQLWDGSFRHAVSGEMARLYLVLWATLAPAWSIQLIYHRRFSRSDPLMIALFFLPLTSGFGSTNTIYFSALHWTVFWAAGLLLLSRTLAHAMEDPRLHRLVIGLVLLTGCAHLFSGHFLHPYMDQAPLWKQTVPTSIGHPATTLKLDGPTSHFLATVRNILDQHGYLPGDDVFGFFNMPGVIYAIGARQPGAPWYFGTWYSNDDTDGGKLRRVAIERRQNAWLITQADVTHFRSHFLECGIDFPTGYEKIGQTINPATGLEIIIWKPKNQL